MGKKYDTRTDEINIGDEGYLPEPKYLHSLYDEDLEEKAWKGSMVLATQGCVAPPSNATRLKAGLKISGYEQSYEETDEEAHEIGFYPLDGRKPFIDWSDREPEGELTYSNNNEFAFAVTTRLLLDYGLTTTNHTKEGITEKIFIDEKKRRYKLPDRFLAMDVILCAKYCRDSFKNYLSRNKELSYHLIEASKIKYFKLGEGTIEEKIETLERRKEEIMF